MLQQRLGNSITGSPVCLITNAIAPYRIPLFNRLNNLLNENFEVVFLARREPDRLWHVYENELQCAYRVLPGWCLSRYGREKAFYINPTTLFYLLARRPSILIVGGYSALAFWVAWGYRQIHEGCRLILWSGTTQKSAIRRQGIALKIKKIFVRGCDSFVTYGKWATDYLVSLGAEPYRIVTGCNVGDIDYFVQQVDKIRAQPGFSATRSQYAKTVIIASGKLIPRKGFEELLDALRFVKSDGWELWVVGAGPLQDTLEAKARIMLSDRVRFWGFLQREELAKLYAMADLGVVPSTTEVGSIVMSEYLASGIFTIGSTYDASAHNLLRSDSSGRIVDPRSTEHLVSALEAAIVKHARGEIDRMLVRQAIVGKDLDAYALSIKQAIEVAVQLGAEW